MAEKKYLGQTGLSKLISLIKGEFKKKADLGDNGKVKTDQLPPLNYIPTSEKGTKNGVATLGEDGKVPEGQLPEMDYDPAGSAAAVQTALQQALAEKLGKNDKAKSAGNADTVGGKAVKNGGWDHIVTVEADGVSDIGKYVDFHAANSSSTDYDVRVTADTTGLDFGNKRLKGLATPTATTDAATKGYVDSVANVEYVGYPTTAPNRIEFAYRNDSHYYITFDTKGTFYITGLKLNGVYMFPFVIYNASSQEYSITVSPYPVNFLIYSSSHDPNLFVQQSGTIVMPPFSRFIFLSN